MRALTGRQGESGIDLTDAEAGHVIATSYAIEPESGQGADLRARETGIAPALTATGGAEQTDRGVRVVKTYRKAARAQTNTDDETWVESETSNTVNTFDVGDTRATELVVARPECVTGDVTHTLTHEGHDASEDGTGRGTPIVSPAVTAKWAKGTGGPSGDEAQNLTTTGPTTVRRLTPLECERLQGFDDGHTATSNGRTQADSARYKQMGNSLAVPVAEWIALRLVAVENERTAG